ncbi:MAG: hypothetical protein QOG55_565, partial [Acidobacteriaceae bacterium]|nr:hypothetical protein [Acidobacteriaceae bacterium]
MTRGEPCATPGLSPSGVVLTVAKLPEESFALVG